MKAVVADLKVIYRAISQASHAHEKFWPSNAFPASPVNARLSRAPRLRIACACSPCLVDRSFRSDRAILN